MPGKFSFYKNGITNKIPVKELSLASAIDLIRGNTFKDDVDRLRTSDNESIRKVVKNGLAYFTFSGTFKQRVATGLIQHSNIICLDFDDVADIPAKKDLATANPHVLGCFLSPSGTGLKVLVHVDGNSHLDTFFALEALFAGLGMEVDKSGKDTSRACFVSYDPEAYFNPDATQFTVDVQAAQVLKQAPAAVAKPHVPLADEEKTLKRIEFVVTQLEEQGIDITDAYENWLEVGFALASVGEQARDFYHRVCQFNAGYTEKDANYKFNDALQKGRFQNPAKFFVLAKAAGVEISLPKELKSVTSKDGKYEILNVGGTAVFTEASPDGKQTATAKSKPLPFEIANVTANQPYWHLCTDDALFAALAAEGTPNLVGSVMATTKEVCDQLRAFGSKVRVISHKPWDDFDLCDSLTAQRFLISIKHGDDDFISYAKYLTKFYATNDIVGSDDSDESKIENMLTLCEHISYFPNAFERDEIAKDIAKACKSSKATIAKEINSFLNTREKDVVQNLPEDENALPAWIDASFYWTYGFYWLLDGPLKTGIYFMTSNGPKRLTNFVLTPLIHVYTQQASGNRRFTEVNNGWIKTVLQLESKAFTSMEFFDTVITGEGPFFTLDGFTKSHLNKLRAYYLLEYPKCFELNTLGWQPEGFFSFSNIIYKDTLLEYNKYGFAQVGDYNYLSMGASNALEGIRAEDDLYKNDKFLVYNQSPIDFKKWAELMVAVYPDHGAMGITYVLMTVFRDILFKRNNNFPILYPFGPVGSGKSKFGESICNFFTHDMSMLNLSNPTDFSFFSVLGRFTNVAIGLNEFDENTIRENIFTAIKGAYDGEGRQKGTGQKNKTTTQAINVAIVLIGQFLSTKDDNSVLTRTIPCKITEDSNRTPEKVARYDELKKYEKQGISSLICDVMDHRQYMADNFIPRFSTVINELKDGLTRDGIAAKNRIVENFSVALTVASIMSERLPLGFLYNTFFEHCKKEIAKMGSVMSESNAMGQFWKTVEFLLDQRLIHQGEHFRVETCDHVRLTIERKPVEKKFEKPTKILFLRLGTVHMLYLSEIRKQTGKTGQNEQTILTYMKDQESYIGSNPSSGFATERGEKINTSSYVFDYDLLNVNLERYRDDAVKEVTLKGKLLKEGRIEEIINVEKLRFTLVQDEGYTNGEGHYINKEILTDCYSMDLIKSYQMKRGLPVQITGTLSERKSGDKVYRSMQVSQIIFQDTITADEKSAAEVDAMFGEVRA